VRSHRRLAVDALAAARQALVLLFVCFFFLGRSARRLRRWSLHLLKYAKVATRVEESELREVESLGSLVNMHLDRISQIWPSGLILTTSSNQMTSRAGIPPGVFDGIPTERRAACTPRGEQNYFGETRTSQEGRRAGKRKVGWGGGRLVGGPSSVITHSLPHSALLLFCWRGSSSTNQAIHAEPQRVWSSDWRLPRRPTSR
jgi:hypothetical protein